jgi:hypothetical protein
LVEIDFEAIFPFFRKRGFVQTLVRLSQGAELERGEGEAAYLEDHEEPE